MKNLKNPDEKVLFVILAIISIIVYLLLIISIFGIIYIIIGLIVALIIQGLYIGHIKGNGIKLSEKQLPEVYSIAVELSRKIGLNKVPDIYLIQSGGMLNAFAAKFLSRNFVIIYSDILELAYEKGQAEVAFIICHELAHIKSKHLSLRWLIEPGLLIPFLGSAYLRACEYTADNYGAYFCSDGAVSGLLILASGKKLYRQVNIQEYCSQPFNDGGFWVSFSEALSTHPNLPNRIKSVQSILNIERGVTDEVYRFKERYGNNADTGNERCNV